MSKLIPVKNIAKSTITTGAKGVRHDMVKINGKLVYEEYVKESPLVYAPTYFTILTQEKNENN